MLKSRKVRKGMALILGLAVLFAMAGKAKAANKVVREGISVSGYTNKMADGTWRDINWKKVKEQGKEFVFIRCGYRGPSDDKIGKGGSKLYDVTSKKCPKEKVLLRINASNCSRL